MSQAGPAALAFSLAALLAGLELYTSTYPRTFFALKRCWAFYGYALVYGVIAFGAMLGLSGLVSAQRITLQGLGLSSPWVQGLVVGITFKSFLHVRLFSVNAGSESFPIGVETIVQLFEPWFLRTIKLDQFYEVRNYIAPRAEKYSDLADVKARIKKNLPKTDPEMLAFLADIEQSESVDEALRLYVNFVGRKIVDSVFPL